MGRKTHRVQYQLDSGQIRALNSQEIVMILRAADELINTGGRNMLVKILKGSKDKKILEYGLQACPAYGFYQQLTMEEIGHRVDWTIRKGFLEIEYNGRLPMLKFSEIGWQIERETYAEELFQKFVSSAAEKEGSIVFQMEPVNRQVKHILLEKLGEKGTADMIPLLAAWKVLEVKKIQSRLGGIIRALEEKQRAERENDVVIAVDFENRI